MAKATVPTGATAKSTSEMKKKKKTTTTTTLVHPPYFQMITEAISSLKDRTGSSQPAIAKFVDEKYGTGLPPNFKKVLSIQLKKFAKSEKLVKVKNSYKITAVTEKAKSVGVGVQLKQQRKKNAAAGDTITEKKEKEKLKVLKKTKEVVKVSTPKNKKKKAVKKLKVESSTKKLLKVKRLGQVKTPEGMKKKKRTPTPWKAPKSIKGSKAVPKKK